MAEWKLDRIRQEKGKPCVDCGNSYPVGVMELDHVRGRKSFGLNKVAVTQAWITRDVFEEELAKCDVRCPTCHRLRHVLERGDGTMSDLVQMRWPEDLVERVDAVAGPRGRTAFTVRALKRALADPSLLEGVAGPKLGRPSKDASTPPVANYGAISRPEVVEALDAAQEGLQGRSEPGRVFRCGCPTRATSPKARCPKHGRSLAA